MKRIKLLVNKILSLFAILFLLLGCVEKQKEETLSQYTIEANLSDFSEDTIFYLYDLEKEEYVDSALVKDNKFKMQGHIAEPPGQFWLTATDKEEEVYTPILIGNDNIRIEASKKDFAWNVKTSGSTIDEAYRQILNETKEWDIKRDSLIFAYHKLTEEEKEKTKDEFLEMVGKLDNILSKRTVAYLKKGHSSYANAITLYDYREELPKDSVQMIFEGYADAVKSSKYGKMLSVYLSSGLLEVGDTYIDYEGINPLREETSLFDLKEENKFLLINYTSAHCGHCIDAFGELKSIYEKYHEKLTIVSISADSKEEDMELLKEMDLWPILWDGKGQYSEHAIRYNFSGTPTFVLISPNGILLDRWVGYRKEMLRRDLQEYL